MIRADVTTEPTQEAVSVEELKDHLRITGSNEDTYLKRLATAARRAAEVYLGKKLVDTTLVGYLPAIPSGECFLLMPGPVRSITSIDYYATDNTSQEWTSDDYTLDATGNIHRVYRNYGASWPSATRTWNPISAEWVAGYGASRTAVPEDIRQAVLLLAAHLWAARQPADVATEQIKTEHKALLYPTARCTSGVWNERRPHESPSSTAEPGQSG